MDTAKYSHFHSVFCVQPRAYKITAHKLALRVASCCTCFMLPAPTYCALRLYSTVALLSLMFMGWECRVLGAHPGQYEFAIAIDKDNNNCLSLGYAHLLVGSARPIAQAGKGQNARGYPTDWMCKCNMHICKWYYPGGMVFCPSWPPLFAARPCAYSRGRCCDVHMHFHLRLCVHKLEFQGLLKLSLGFSRSTNRNTNRKRK